MLAAGGWPSARQTQRRPTRTVAKRRGGQEGAAALESGASRRLSRTRGDKILYKVPKGKCPPLAVISYGCPANREAARQARYLPGVVPDPVARITELLRVAPTWWAIEEGRRWTQRRYRHHPSLHQQHPLRLAPPSALRDLPRHPSRCRSR